MLGKADSHVLYWNQACARQTEALIPVKPAGQGLYLPQTFPLIWLPQCPMENWKKDVLNSFALWFFFKPVLYAYYISKCKSKTRIR
jgi:hypothetical protein